MIRLSGDIEQNLISEEDEVKAGRVRNCFIRLDCSDLPFIDLYYPRSNDDDIRAMRPLLDETIIERREWLDSGIKIFLKKNAGKEAGEMVDAITSYFAQQYPDEAFKLFKTYSCGRLSTIVQLYINENNVIKYCEELRRDFTKNFIKAIYHTPQADAVSQNLLQAETANQNQQKPAKVFINTYEFGTLEYKNGMLDMHRWENEDEAQSVSELSRRYTQRIMDGVIDDPGTKNAMVDALAASMQGKAIGTREQSLLEGALNFVRSLSNTSRSV